MSLYSQVIFFLHLLEVLPPLPLPPPLSLSNRYFAQIIFNVGL